MTNNPGEMSGAQEQKSLPIARRAIARAAHESEGRPSFRRALPRVLICALAVAAVAGSAAFLGQSVAYRATVAVSARDASHSSRLRQAAWILDEARTLEQALQSEGVSTSEWFSLLNRDAIGHRVRDDAVEIFVNQPDAPSAARLAIAVAAAFKRFISAGSEKHEIAAVDAREADQSRLERELADSRSRLSGADLDPALVSDHFSAGRRKIESLTAELSRRRAELTALRSQDFARAVLSPDQVTSALQEDEMYRQDGLELERNGEQYRTEFLLAIDRLPEPLNRLSAALRDLLHALSEQIDLKPAAPLRAVLEKLQSDARALHERVASFAENWDKGRQSVVELIPGVQAGAMLERHANLVDSVDQLLSAVNELVAQARNQLDDLASSGGTRENVVSSVVRGHLGPIEERVRAASEAAAALDPAHNFRLDASDRLIRALLTRRRDREQSLRKSLQEQADESALRNRDLQLRSLAENVGQLEQSRESVLETSLNELARLLGSVVAWAQDQQLVGRIAALQGELDLAITHRPPDRPAPMEVNCSPAVVEQYLGRDRLSNALLVAAAALVVTPLIGMVALVSTRRE